MSDPDRGPLLPHELAAVREVLKDAPQHKRSAQFVRDYDAYGRAGGFMLTCAKWVGAITVLVLAVRSGLLAFLGTGL